MEDLIEALTILNKYGNPDNPTNCDHDILRVYIDDLTPDMMDKEDIDRLDDLDFFWEEDFECFASYRFGSC